MARREKRVGLEEVNVPGEYFNDADDEYDDDEGDDSSYHGAGGGEENDPNLCTARSPPLDFSLESCAHCNRGITVPPSDDGTYDFIQLLCSPCFNKTKALGVCPTCWMRHSY